MAKFCEYCGRPLGDMETCSCPASLKANKPVDTPVNNPVNNGINAGENTGANYNYNYNAGNTTSGNNFGNTIGNIAGNIGNIANNIDKEKAKGFWESMKNRMGIGDPESNKTDAFEKNKNIIPDCVRPNEGEVPVKQYKIATLRNRILGIPYIKAIGRIQVTNKRVIFRAPGRCLAGRTSLQHEFAIDEVAGIEARREYGFNFWDMLLAIFVMAVGGFVASFLTAAFRSEAMAIIMGLLLGVAGCVPFFMIKKLWLVKTLCLGASVLGLVMAAIAADLQFLLILALFPFVFLVFSVMVFSIKPNLVLIIKTKGSTEAIDIKRKRATLFGGAGSEKEDHTGFAEILPEDDAEKSIRELGAIITDIQKLGDFGISKWKA